MRGPALAAGGIGAVVDVGYLFVVGDPGTDVAPRIAFIATFFAAMSAFSFGGAVIARRNEGVGRSLLAAAATGFLEAGVLALPSLGITLILAGLFAAAAAPRRVSAGVVAAIILVTLIFVGGILLT